MVMPRISWCVSEQNLKVNDKESPGHDSDCQRGQSGLGIMHVIVRPNLGCD